MDIRRVVTGHDTDGNAVFASDEMVAPVTLAAMPGAEFHRLWGADSPQTYPDSGVEPSGNNYFPDVGGFRFGFFTLPPDQETRYPDDIEAAMVEVEAKMPGMMAHMAPEEPGMHTTDTADYEIVISGQEILELDNGAEVLLGPGDTVIQNGTRDRWRNPGSEPALIGAVLVRAHRP